MLARPKKEKEIQPQGWKYISTTVTRAGFYRPCQIASKTKSRFRELSAPRCPTRTEGGAEQEQQIALAE
jgi:hypothetical protein